MRILLIQPAPFEPGRLGLENVIWLSEPVALTSLAAMVPKHEVKILDMRLEQDTELNRVLQSFKPQLVGVTAMTTDCYQAKAALEIARNTLGSDVFTLVGGHHPTMCPADYDDDCIDATCIGEGEETFVQLVEHLASGAPKTELGHIAGLRYRTSDGSRVTNAKRAQVRELDTFPMPARHLIPERYRSEYFFTVAHGMGSMQTSRGCSFDCNFCGIWEFYERRTRYLSAAAICDRLERMPEKVVFFLDDNFLTNKKRLEALCDEIEKRGIKKYYGTQGRADFVAANPELMKRLRDCGLIMVLSGYETNDDNGLEALRKGSTRDENRRAADILRDLGIISTGIFMVRPDFSERDFDLLYETINEMGIAIPLVTVLTPLPGTQLHRAKKDELLTDDVRFFDLLHAVTPTKLPRQRFYEKYAEYNKKTWPAFFKGVSAALRRRPAFFAEALPGILKFVKKANHYRPIVESHESHMRDEVGVISHEITAANVATKKRKLPVVSAEVSS